MPSGRLLVAQANLVNSPAGVTLVSNNAACASCQSGCGVRQPLGPAVSSARQATVSVDAKVLTQCALLVFGLPLAVMLLLGYGLANVASALSLQPESAAGIAALVFLLGFSLVAIVCRFVAKPFEQRLGLKIEA